MIHIVRSKYSIHCTYISCTYMSCHVMFTVLLICLILYIYTLLYVHIYMYVLGVEGQYRSAGGGCLGRHQGAAPPRARLTWLV